MKFLEVALKRLSRAHLSLATLKTETSIFMRLNPRSNCLQQVRKLLGSFKYLISYNDFPIYLLSEDTTVYQEWWKNNRSFYNLQYVFFYLRTAKKKFNLNINDTICLRKYIQKYIFIYKSACKRNLIFLILCIKFQYAFSYSKFTNCTNLQAKVYETSIQSFIFNETIFAKY